ncbi:MAG: transposase [Planctomycetota bacterium]|jgi:putative transposase
MRRVPIKDEADAVFNMTARVNWRFWHLAPEHRAAIFLRLLEECASKYDVDVLGYALMSNHYHFVSRNPPPSRYRELTSRVTRNRHRRPWPPGHPNATVRSQFMRRLMWTASRAIQADLDVSGRFWEGPYFPRRVRDSRHLLVALAYDHLNPVRENMVIRAEDYRRSSAAWWAWQGDSPVTLLRRPLPFGLEFGEFRQRLLACQADQSFPGAMQEIFESGADLSSDEGRRQLRELLRRVGLA